MLEYKRVLSEIGAPEWVLRVAQGDLTLPIYADVPARNYGYVPALIPLWSRDNPSYIGYWKHWFVPREMTIAQMYIDGGRRVREVARDPAQLARVVVLESVTDDDGIAPRTRSFAEAAGVSTSELDELDEISARNGDQPAGLLSLAMFSDDPPALLIDEGDPGSLVYQGDFPTTDPPGPLAHSCSVEFPLDVQARLATTAEIPPWYGGQNQPRVFEALLDREDFGGAWLTLNSAGWEFSAAKRAARELRDRANGAGRAEPEFNALIDAWLAQPHERAGAFLVPS